MMQSCASAAKLRAAGPFSPSAYVPCQLPVPATSDRQSAVRPERQRECRVGKKPFPGAFSACRTQDDALQCLAVGDKAPERNEQLACHSHLLDEYHFSFDSLVLANSLTTLIAVPLVFLLPRLLVLRKDAEIHEETPGLETAME
jgi:hypothetical protein